MSEYVYFRGFKCCPCLKEWLPELEKELLRRKIIKYHIDIWQLIGGAPQSGGTHTKGGAFDLGQFSTAAVYVIRQMGADADWHRPYNWDGRKGMEHGHGVLRGCPHNGPARYQYSSRYVGVDYGHNGLASGGKDTGPKPLSKRTWKEGIAWAHQQQAEAAKGTSVSIPKPLLADDTTLTFGYGNMGPTNYVLTTADKKRLQRQVAEIHKMGVSMFVALELHEEHGDRGGLEYIKTLLPEGWGVFEGDGGNHLLIDKTKYTLIKTENHMSHNRAFSEWNIRRTSTGLAFWVNGLHTTAGKGPKQVIDRVAQTKDFIIQTRLIARGIWAADLNNYSLNTPGSPHKQMKDAGIRSIFDLVRVDGAERNSHHDKVNKGQHIDFVGVGSLVTVLSAILWNTRDKVNGDLADHDWVKMICTIKGTKPE